MLPRKVIYVLSQHELSVRKAINTDAGECAVITHFKQTGHRLDLNKAKNLDNSKLYKRHLRRLKKESLHICYNFNW